MLVPCCRRNARCASFPAPTALPKTGTQTSTQALSKPNPLQLTQLVEHGAHLHGGGSGVQLREADLQAYGAIRKSDACFAFC